MLKLGEQYPVFEYHQMVVIIYIISDTYPSASQEYIVGKE